MAELKQAAALSVRGLTVAYDGQDAVDDVSLDLPAGEVLAVLGPSGCGKSTLLRAIAGLEEPESGSILFDGADLVGVPTHRRGFALMFQDGQLFGHQSVAENVGYPLRLRRTPRTEVRARVAELLELVGLPDHADRRPDTLSGGERQRVALARALAVSPRLLLLDEPLSALDKTLRERLAAELRDILATAGTTALLVTHDHDEAFTVAGRMALMRAGRIVQEGPIEEVWAQPADPDAARFLGYARVLDGAAADRVLTTAGLPTGAAVALRRSALTVSDDGPLAGIVVASRVTPEQLRLEVDVPDLGVLDAVAPLGTHTAGAGEQVRLNVDRTRLAAIPVD
ncbi:ABC transporter ATP-binding protein [Nocardioides speluncae]|uniref:ABC transporter ATP-binding protein n=1 Tax=Nocardioides speluncae TaxID=2670337 RepID=UPI000D689D95|nr:ABC transporter ATP-binding protein [Nocardioides speluncae]